jgi:hypothetical protein
MHESHDKKVVIYYNASDIFLGTALLVLVVFFINDYLSHTPTSKNYAENPMTPAIVEFE